MDCPKTECGEVVVPCPPDDSLVEIFSRLPAKPLFRFKCVSKDWCGLIADRLRCRKFPQTLQGFFSGNAVESYGDFIDLSGRPVPLVDPSFSFLTKSPEIKKIVLLDSCNGLVLFGHRRVLEDRYDSLGYIVCNPATEEWVSVPSCCGNYSDDEDNEDIDTLWAWVHSDNEDNQGYAPDTYLVFDPAISPHFQLIQFRTGDLFDLEEVHTFSSVIGAWRWMRDPEGVTSHSTVGTCVCCFNGMLHLGAHQFDLPSEEQHMILAVGGEGRPFRTLHWPQNDRGIIVFVGPSQGHLHCLSGCTTGNAQMTELSIWVLEDYNAEKWVLRDNVSLSQLFKRTRCCFILDWNVVGIHPDCGLVSFAEYWNHKLILYDMDKKEVRAICSLHGFRQPMTSYVPYFAQSAALAKKHWNCCVWDTPWDVQQEFNLPRMEQN